MGVSVIAGAAILGTGYAIYSGERAANAAENIPDPPPPIVPSNYTGPEGDQIWDPGSHSYIWIPKAMSEADKSTANDRAKLRAQYTSILTGENSKYYTYGEGDVLPAAEGKPITPGYYTSGSRTPINETEYDPAEKQGKAGHILQRSKPGVFYFRNQKTGKLIKTTRKDIGKFLPGPGVFYFRNRKTGEIIKTTRKEGGTWPSDMPTDPTERAALIKAANDPSTANVYGEKYFKNKQTGEIVKGVWQEPKKVTDATGYGVHDQSVDTTKPGYYDPTNWQLIDEANYESVANPKYSAYANAFTNRMQTKADEDYGKLVRSTDETMFARGIGGSRAYVDLAAEREKDKQTLNQDINAQGILAGEQLSQWDKDFAARMVQGVDTGERADLLSGLQAQNQGANVASNTNAQRSADQAYNYNAIVNKWAARIGAMQQNSANMMDTSTGLMYLYGLNKGGGGGGGSNIWSNKNSANYANRWLTNPGKMNIGG